jgi:hypothetical protein
MVTTVAKKQNAFSVQMLHLGMCVNDMVQFSIYSLCNKLTNYVTP